MSIRSATYSFLYVKPKSYSIEKLAEACKLSTSTCQALKFLGLNEESGGNRQAFLKNVLKYNLDISHFSGQGRKGKRQNKQRPYEDMFRLDIPFSDTLKRRLIEDNLLGDVCIGCGIKEWKTTVGSEPMSLQVDHINGNRNDNRLENLRLVCPNCHSCTSTFCSRNKKHKAKPSVCKCGASIARTSKRCQACAVELRPKFTPKTKLPPKEELILRLQTTTKSKLARELGVSRAAIRYHLKRG